MYAFFQGYEVVLISLVVTYRPSRCEFPYTSVGVLTISLLVNREYVNLYTLERDIHRTP